MPSKISVETAAVLHCGRCGFRYRNPGDENTACPECGFEKPLPVHIWGGAVEYALADRRKGYALEDIRFGKLAQWAGLISVNQYQEALSVQREMLGRLGKIPCLAEVMLKRKFMSQREVEAVLRARVDGWQDPSDDDFGKLALSKNMITQAQFQAAKQVQHNLYESDREVPPLPLILYEKRYLQDKEIAALVQAQEQKRMGIAVMIRSASSRAKSTSSLVPRILGEKGPARRNRIAAMVIVIALLTVLFWRFGGIGGTKMVATYCTHCSARRAASLNSEWPLDCDTCGNKTVYPMAVCTRHGHLFHIENPGSPGIRCPECGTSQYLMLTVDVDPAEYRKGDADEDDPAQSE